ncbi:MAG TPA: aminoglycoside phosphotransferase family protein [Bryobacteraceae bacterium]|nr:aminoglycoside phosphotransferase family protein [Bryobacteraceae bacterium]
MVEQLSTFLSQNTIDWGLPAGGTWKFWVYNNYHPHCTNLDVMWFHDDDAFPRVITKLDHQRTVLAGEFEHLAEVHSCSPAYVPRPLGFGRIDDLWALWMEGLPGLPCRTDYSPHILRGITGMLVSIHASVRDWHRPADSGRYHRAVMEPLQSVVQFGDSEAVRAGCALLASRIREEWINSLPVIPQHGDFCAGNIISFRGQLHVLDWETFGRTDLPFYDLFTFLISLFNGGGDLPPHIPPALAAQVPTIIELYATGMGLATPDTELLLPLALVNWFHLMWLDGREKFTSRMYKLIEHFFEHADLWQQAFGPPRESDRLR